MRSRRQGAHGFCNNIVADRVVQTVVQGRFQTDFNIQIHANALLALLLMRMHTNARQQHQVTNKYVPERINTALAQGLYIRLKALLHVPAFWKDVT